MDDESEVMNHCAMIKRIKMVAYRLKFKAEASSLRIKISS